MKKVALVTGASRGIGAETAKLLAREGYLVCVNFYRNADKANEVVTAIEKDEGKAIAVKADIGNEAEIIQLFETIDKELGPVSALVNNAGMNGGTCEVENIEANCLESVFKTNVFGTFYCCREAIKRMKKLGKGSIVNVSSEAARFGGNRMAHYAASKAAVNTFTIAFAREAGVNNVTINTVSPGIIDTDMYVETPPERLQTLKKSVPLGRMGTAQEVAQTIAWLLSDKASYLNGAVIPIAGGR